MPVHYASTEHVDRAGLYIVQALSARNRWVPGPQSLVACVPNQAEPLVRADHQGGAHTEPVWALRWLDKGPEFEELLVSVSADGRVSQWSTGQVGAGDFGYDATPPIMLMQASAAPGLPYLLALCCSLLAVC